MSTVESHGDPVPASGAAPASSARGLKRLILLLVVPLIVALIVGGIYLRGGRMVETDNAYVKADLVPVSAEVAGTITEVLIRENQAVSAGQALFRIDPAPFEVAVSKAAAKLAQVRCKEGFSCITAEGLASLADTSRSSPIRERRESVSLDFVWHAWLVRIGALAPLRALKRGLRAPF